MGLYHTIPYYLRESTSVSDRIHIGLNVFPDPDPDTDPKINFNVALNPGCDVKHKV
jgi:hypothetical protein